MVELAKIGEDLRRDALEVWSRGELHGISQRLIAPLGLDAHVTLSDDLPDAGQAPAIAPTWRLLIRQRRVMFLQFFERLKQVAASTDHLPAPIVALAAGEAEAKRVLLHHGQDWEAVAEHLLLPLATNEQQEQIAQKLATHNGVTVQGPPGTGKSHTIANLISHLVAHGKRVLVTAHKDQTLAVLRDKIPAELRDLSLAILGSSAADMAALQRSVNAITEAADLVDEQRESSLIASLQEQLRSAEKEVLQLRQRLRDSLSQEGAELTLGTHRRRAAELAEWLAHHQAEMARIPDAIEADVPCPLSAHEASELFALSRRVEAEDALAAAQALPHPEQLPTGRQLAERDQALAATGKKLSDHNRHITTWAAVDALTDEQLSMLIDATVQARDHLASLESGWLTRLRFQVTQAQQWRDLWAGHAHRLQADTIQCARLRSAVAGAHVSMLEGYSPREAIELLRQLRQRFQEGKRVSSLLQRRLTQFLKGLSIDGHEPDTAEDVDRILAYLELSRIRSSAAQLWMGDIAPTSEAPALPVDAPAVEMWLEARAQEILQVLGWETQHWPALRTKLRTLIAPDLIPPRCSSTHLHQIVEVLSDLRVRAQQCQPVAGMEELAATLTAGRQAQSASPLWAELATALAGADWQRWDAALATAARLHTVYPKAIRLAELHQRLASLAPLWAQQIRESRGDVEQCGEPSEIDELWQWRQADTWLSKLLKANDAEEIQRRLTHAQEELRRITLELTRRSAWLGAKRNLGDSQRQALVGWLQTLRRIGRGTSERANKWRAEAQRLMPQAMGAVPVWIMPYYRVAESFDPSVAPAFDVVIVDESSQCDVFALGLLGLGHKVIVVGDDKQISPSAVGVNRERVDELVHAHLRDFPNALLLDLESSLYDASTRLFPGVVRLREHFRSLPSIIEFSSQRYYGGEIQPLREESSHSLPGATVRAIYVPGGVRRSTNIGEANEAEAAAIVDQIIHCCNDPAYAGRTFGVISLLGNSKQAEYIDQRLLHKLGPAEYEKRQLRCGDSYSFQGDERDVIFISVVADDNRSAFTSKAYEQRVNVAASRAKDQLWVFHSVQPEQLHPDDQRAALIRYCVEQQPLHDIAEGLEERCESDFERRVLRQLTDRGYRVSPQHRVGSLRIDLVVHGDGRKLAIECDGDKYHGPDQWESDLRRQTILERLGWRFWRVRGSAFYRDPEAAMAPLWTLLIDLGIDPGESTSSEPTPASSATSAAELAPVAPKPRQRQEFEPQLNEFTVAGPFPLSEEVKDPGQLAPQASPAGGAASKEVAAWYDTSEEADDQGDPSPFSLAPTAHFIQQASVGHDQTSSTTQPAVQSKEPSPSQATSPTEVRGGVDWHNQHGEAQLDPKAPDPTGVVGQTATQSSIDMLELRGPAHHDLPLSAPAKDVHTDQQAQVDAVQVLADKAAEEEDSAPRESRHEQSQGHRADGWLESTGRNTSGSAPSLDDLFNALSRPDETATSAPSQPEDGDIHTAAIRQWALAQGHTVGDRGRLPARIVDAYRRAMSVASDTKASPATAKALSEAQAFRHLRVLRGILVAKGVQCILSAKAPELLILGPRHVVTETAGKVAVSRPDGQFTWGPDHSRFTHAVEDHEDVANKIVTSRTALKPRSNVRPAVEEADPFPLQTQQAVSAFDDEQLTTAAKWALRQGVEPTPEKVVHLIITKLAPPHKPSVWDLQRVYSAVTQIQPIVRKKAPATATATAEALARQDDRPRIGSVLPPLQTLRRALARHGIAVELVADDYALIVKSPPDAVTRTAGQIRLSAPYVNFTWGSGTVMSMHSARDPEGVARKILGYSPQTSTRATPHHKAPPAASPTTRPSDAQIRSHLGKLRDALARYRVEAELLPTLPILVVRSPEDAAQRTNGRITASLSTRNFVWGKGLLRATHPLNDVEGAARNIAGRLRPALSVSDSTSPVPPPGSSPARPSRPPRLGGRAITTYRPDELVALIQWLVSEGRAATYDSLIDEALAELRLPGRSPRRVEAIEEAAVLARWKATPTETLP
ncbi:histone-like nucleoid-structuring protein Lsr2 [Nonomuraea sp. NPDC047897]|uniref:AAA domain-containing protein n=1 Tax=Nonomuraea sp. NPDC047897 TaxID=3364346 RepID=UPI0037232525